jgi:hypothetical protein
MRGVLHAPHRGLPKKHLAALQHWLPAFGAEVLLLAAFLSWIGYRDTGLHGLAVVYAWVVYGLIALGLLYLWICSAPDEGAKRS